MTAPDRETLAAWFEAELTWDRFRAWSSEDFADALLAGPLATPAAAPGSDAPLPDYDQGYEDGYKAGCRNVAAAPGPDGEAVERVREALADAEEIRSQVVISRSDAGAVLAAVDRLTAERETWVQTVAAAVRIIGDERAEAEMQAALAADVAFAAAFAPEEGGYEEFGAKTPTTGEVGYVSKGESNVRAVCPDGWIVVRRVVGPWKPAPAPSPGSGEDGGSDE